MGLLDFEAMSKLGEKLNHYLEESAKQLIEINRKLDSIEAKLENKNE